MHDYTPTLHKMDIQGDIKNIPEIDKRIIIQLYIKQINAKLHNIFHFRG